MSLPNDANSMREGGRIQEISPKPPIWVSFSGGRFVERECLPRGDFPPIFVEKKHPVLGGIKVVVNTWGFSSFASSFPPMICRMYTASKDKKKDKEGVGREGSRTNLPHPPALVVFCIRRHPLSGMIQRWRGIGRQVPCTPTRKIFDRVSSTGRPG